MRLAYGLVLVLGAAAAAAATACESNVTCDGYYVCQAGQPCYCGGVVPSSGGSTSSGSTSSGASANPMLVRVETGRTLTASPGDGVGVFVTYQSGGHWTMWWTCDTNKTSNVCNYEVSAQSQTSAISNLAGYDGTVLSPPDGGYLEAGAPEFPILGQVTDKIQGVTFDTDPGAVI